MHFSLRLHPSNCVSVLTLRKSDKQKKKKGYVFLDAWDFTCLAGCFAFMWRFYMLGVRTWEIVWVDSLVSKWCAPFSITLLTPNPMHGFTQYSVRVWKGIRVINPVSGMCWPLWIGIGQLDPDPPSSDSHSFTDYWVFTKANGSQCKLAACMTTSIIIKHAFRRDSTQQPVAQHLVQLNCLPLLEQ